MPKKSKRKEREEESEGNAATEENHETPDAPPNQPVMRMFIDAVSNLKTLTKETLGEYTLKKYNTDIFEKIVSMKVMTRSAVRAEGPLENLLNLKDDSRKKRKRSAELHGEKDTAKAKTTRNTLAGLKVKKTRTVKGNIEKDAENIESKTPAAAKSRSLEKKKKPSGATDDTLETKPLKQKKNQTADESVDENTKTKPIVAQESKTSEKKLKTDRVTKKTLMTKPVKQNGKKTASKNSEK